MLVSWDVILGEMFWGILSMIKSLLIVLIPLFVLIEILVKTNAMEKLAKKLAWFGRLIGISPKAVFPLLVAIVMGVTYGAGTLIELNKTNPLSKRDFAIIGIFVYMCHGMVETGLIFFLAGANVWVITVGRFLIALIVTIIASKTKWIKRLSTEAPKITSELDVIEA